MAPVQAPGSHAQGELARRRALAPGHVPARNRTANRRALRMSLRLAVRACAIRGASDVRAELGRVVFVSEGPWRARVAGGRGCGNGRWRRCEVHAARVIATAPYSSQHATAARAGPTPPCPCPAPAPAPRPRLQNRQPSAPGALRARDRLRLRSRGLQALSHTWRPHPGE